MKVKVWTSASTQKEKDKNNKYVKKFTCAVIDETWSFRKKNNNKNFERSSVKEKKNEEIKEIKKKSTEKIDTKEFIKRKSRRRDFI